VRVSRDRSGRGGKTVTTVSGLSGTLEVMEDFSRILRKAMGSGGTLKEGRIEVQGDHVDRVLEWLLAKGIKAKRSGG
jgi:translation initiation factor 1